MTIRERVQLIFPRFALAALKVIDFSRSQKRCRDKGQEKVAENTTVKWIQFANHLDNLLFLKKLILTKVYVSNIMFTDNLNGLYDPCEPLL